jgi:hypothetical protein
MLMKLGSCSYVQGDNSDSLMAFVTGRGVVQGGVGQLPLQQCSHTTHAVCNPPTQI